MEKDYIDKKWFVVGQPWGDGTWIVAGHPDPHLGKFVCSCEEEYDEEDAINDARNRALHITEIHNQHLTNLLRQTKKSRL